MYKILQTICIFLLSSGVSGSSTHTNGSIDRIIRVECDDTITNTPWSGRVGSVCWINRDIILPESNINILYEVLDDNYSIDSKYPIYSNYVNVDYNKCKVPWHKDRINQKSLPFDCNMTSSIEKRVTDVSVYVFDSGCQKDHLGFNGQNIILAPNFADGLSKLSWDAFDHGTHVTGLISSNAYGTSRGLIKNTICVKVLDYDGRGRYYYLIKAIEWAVNDKRSGKKIFNFSLSGPRNKLIDDILEESYKMGIISVVSAGNGGKNSCSDISPNGPNLIKVGASDQSDYITYFSNYGPCVTLNAPGMNIISLAPDINNLVPRNCLSVKHNKSNKVRYNRCRSYNSRRNKNGLKMLSGTSMSAPIVTGYLAYITSIGIKNPVDFIKKNTGLTKDGKPILFVS